VEIRIVTGIQEITELQRFQEQRYFESGLLTTHPGTPELDEHFGASVYFGVYHGNEIVGTARLIGGDYPMAGQKFDREATRRLRRFKGTVYEVSRMAVSMSVEPFKVSAMLTRGFLQYVLRRPVAALVVAAVDPPAVRLMNRMHGIPLRVIGEPFGPYGGVDIPATPIMIDPLECLEVFSRPDYRSKRGAFFLEGLEDLVD
jgi:hypothetical protein